MGSGSRNDIGGRGVCSQTIRASTNDNKENPRQKGGDK